MYIYCYPAATRAKGLDAASRDIPHWDFDKILTLAGMADAFKKTGWHHATGWELVSYASAELAASCSSVVTSGVDVQ